MKMGLTSLSIHSPLYITRPLRYHYSILSTFTSPLFIPYSKTCNLNLQKSAGDSVDRKVACSLLKVEEDLNDEVCELVSGVDLSLGEREDSIHAYLFKAVKFRNCWPSKII